MSCDTERPFHATDYKISTITATGNIGSEVALDIFYEHIDIESYEGKIPSIIYAEFGNNKHDQVCKGFNPKKKFIRKDNVKVRSTKRFDNSVTVRLKIYENTEINMKIFKNGKVQMTGIKKHDDGLYAIECMNSILKFIQHTANENFIGDVEKLQVSDYNIHLINSDFRVNMEIRRDLLHALLVNKYKVTCTYEPCIYPGVKIQYYLNKNNLNDLENFDIAGKCCCKNSICSGKGDGFTTDACKKITISVFQSGCILITGVTKVEHITIGYNFITEILRKNRSTISRVKISLDGLVKGLQ